MGRVRLLLVAVAVMGSAVLTLAQEIVVPYTFDNGTLGTLPCRLSAQELPDYTRVNISHGPPSVCVAADEPFYVTHGFGGGYEPDFLAALDSQQLAAFLLKHERFELKVNGASVTPDYISVDPTSGVIRWFFLFPAGRLQKGVCVFEGRWWEDVRDVEIAAFLPEYVTDVWDFDFSASCTVSVF